MGSLSPAQLNSDEEEDEEVNPAEGMSMKDIMSCVRGRKRSGVPMPSTVERRKQQKRKRREEREKRDVVADADVEVEAGADKAAGAVDAQATGAAAGVENVAGDAAGQDDSAPQGSSNGGPPLDGDAGTEDIAPASEDISGVSEPVVVAPKVTVDADGNIIIDRESLCISAGTGLGSDKGPADVITMEANDSSRRITAATYAKRDSAMKWTPEDTQKFFDSLSRFGTDFALIKHAFPKRSRRQIKLKYKREERDNPKKIDEYLKARPQAMTIADTRKTLNLLGNPETSAPLVGAVRTGDASGIEDTEKSRETLPDDAAALQAEATNDDENDDDENGVPAEKATELGSNSLPAEASQSLGATQMPADAPPDEEEEEQYLY